MTLTSSYILKERVTCAARTRIKKKATVLGAQTLTSSRITSRLSHTLRSRAIGTRPFYTAAHLSEDVIAGVSSTPLSIPTASLLPLLAPHCFITWQRAVGLDTQVGSALFQQDRVLCRYPRYRIKQRAESSRPARESPYGPSRPQPGVSLADAWRHRACSRLTASSIAPVDRAFGAKKPLETNEERLALPLQALPGDDCDRQLIARLDRDTTDRQAGRAIACTTRPSNSTQCLATLTRACRRPLDRQRQSEVSAAIMSRQVSTSAT